MKRYVLALLALVPIMSGSASRTVGRPMRRLMTTVILLLLTAVAYAESPTGVQVDPDESVIMVQKDVGAERWAISLNLDPAHHFNATGNVFHSDGGDPSFIACAPTDVRGSMSDLGNMQFTWDCFGADRCQNSDCGASAQWSFIATVTLPGTFFLPAESNPQPTPVRTAQPTPHATPIQFDSLAALIGTWDFTFTIIETFTDTYRLQQIVTSGDTRGLAGLNEFGDTVAAFRVQELVPGSPLPFEFELVDVEEGVLCEFHFFNRTGETSVSGETFLTAVDSAGKCDISALGSPHAMTGVRTSTVSAVSASEAVGRPLEDVKAAHGLAVLTEVNALGERTPAADDAVSGAIAAALRVIGR